MSFYFFLCLYHNAIVLVLHRKKKEVAVVVDNEHNYPLMQLTSWKKNVDYAECDYQEVVSTN